MPSSSSPVRVVITSIAAALLAGVCNPGCFRDDCAIHSSCPGDNCQGDCVPLPPLGFDGPALLWVGPENELPDCPADAPRPVYVGKRDVDDSDQCPACACSAPACVYPAAMTASTQDCLGAGTTTEYATPAGWGGECTTIAPAPALPVGSMTSAPMTVRPCKPIGPEVPAGGGGASQFPPPMVALACEGEVVDTVCNDPSRTCVPAAQPSPSPGFRQCIAWFHEDKPVCPTEYPDEVILYADIEDTRSCSACECTEIFPSNCAAEVSFYSDSACTTFVTYAQVTDASGPGCGENAPPSATIGSVKATTLIDDPGSCVASGGVQTGQVVRTGPTTFCCQPP